MTVSNFDVTLRLNRKKIKEFFKISEIKRRLLSEYQRIHEINLSEK